MRKILAVLVCLSVLSVVSVGYAHPPSSIKIAFDPKTKMLEAVIVHTTSDPAKHYIKKVDIGLNGGKVIEHLISMEDNRRTQTVRYLIPDAKDGDVLSVEGYCSINGKRKAKIKVGK